MINIIGGTYWETCIEPDYHELYGSGLRAAFMLSKKTDVTYYTCIGKDDIDALTFKANSLGIKTTPTIIDKTVEFEYYHPLSKPIAFNVNHDVEIMPDMIFTEPCLFYGMIEATVKIQGDYVVYDPQNHVKFSDTFSSAKHLALILNLNEAKQISGLNDDIETIGTTLLTTENAEVIVIKNGANGAMVFYENNIDTIPVFESNKVWPIGSGDVFSAIFAWSWMIKKETPKDSALLASKYVANFCNSGNHQIEKLKEFEPLTGQIKTKNIYLASPFFSMAERFLVNQFRNSLIDFGNEVYSPFHDSGIVDIDNEEDVNKITSLNLDHIQNADVIVAILNGNDPGTIFEIGYARALNKKTIIFCENFKENDLFMLKGSGCEITSDLTTTVYKASW